MNVHTTHIENLAIGAEFTFSAGRFGILATRVGDKEWTFDMLNTDMQPTGNQSKVYPSYSWDEHYAGHVLRARAEYDNAEFFVSQTEHHSPRNAIRDALVILTIG